MKERPILFSEPMVREILDGRKTQTRRVIKYPGHPHKAADIQHREPGDKWYKDCTWSMRTSTGTWGDYTHDRFMQFCPYGQPGDRLWVRETWALAGGLDSIAAGEMSSLAAEHQVKTGLIWYRAEGEQNISVNPTVGEMISGRGKWRPSIHMPRKFSRINLEITAVRVERLQNISIEDARAEGSYLATDIDDEGGFINLWDSINAARGYGWDSNPWVWVVEFKVIP